MDIPNVPDRLLNTASEALHEACCGGGDLGDPRLAELDQLGHTHDALVVFDAIWARLHAASLRWAADRVRRECQLRGGDACCARCTTSAAQLDAWAATAELRSLTPTHPDPGPHEEARR